MGLADEFEFEFLEREFSFPDSVTKVTPLGSGHIHDTYLVSCGDTDCSRFVLQKFNHHVFRHPHQVASNIWLVLGQILNSKSSLSQHPLHLLKTKKDTLLYHSSQGEYWRVFNYIEGSDSFDQVTHPDQAQGAAKAFGSFIEALNGLDPQRLHTTIPDFHNLQVRFEQLKQAVISDKVSRVKQYGIEVEFAMLRESLVHEYSSLVTSGEIPLRVTHNDTKINNVLFQKGTTKAICVIDLDTVMPGVLLYDFGDMARTFCNSVTEENEADQAVFRLDIFEALCKGFFTSLKTQMTSVELDSLKIGPWWMTYIMGIRFLADFLSGDTYYKIHHPLQNLRRARNQFRLLKDIENQQADINSIIDATVKAGYS